MQPKEIHNDRAAGILRIEWQAGNVQELKHARLRTDCPCADCKAGRQIGISEAEQPDVRIVAINPVGAYAVQLVFSDRHDRGIYPWAYLRELCS